MVEFTMTTRSSRTVERARAALFQRLVERTFRDLPPEIRRRISNLEIVVEVEPTAEQLERQAEQGDDLFGLYEGVPIPLRSFSSGFEIPDRIVIFREPLQRAFPDPNELKEELRVTLLHELAHHFGLDED